MANYLVVSMALAFLAFSKAAPPSGTYEGPVFQPDPNIQPQSDQAYTQDPASLAVPYSTAYNPQPQAIDPQGVPQFQGEGYSKGYEYQYNNQPGFENWDGGANPNGDVGPYVQDVEPVFGLTPYYLITSLVPGSKAAVAFLGKTVGFIFGAIVFLIAGVTLTAGVCAFTPFCTLHFKNIFNLHTIHEEVRSLATPERLALATSIVQNAIDKYQKIQKSQSSKKRR